MQLTRHNPQLDLVQSYFLLSFQPLLLHKWIISISFPLSYSLSILEEVLFFYLSSMTDQIYSFVCSFHRSFLLIHCYVVMRFTTRKFYTQAYYYYFNNKTVQWAIKQQERLVASGGSDYAYSLSQQSSVLSWSQWGPERASTRLDVDHLTDKQRGKRHKGLKEQIH